jgi:hypothetical protein
LLASAAQSPLPRTTRHRRRRPSCRPSDRLGLRPPPRASRGWSGLQAPKASDGRALQPPQRAPLRGRREPQRAGDGRRTAHTTRGGWGIQFRPGRHCRRLLQRQRHYAP